MDQVNINAPPPAAPPPPPRQPSRWPLALFIAILAILVIAGVAVAAFRRNQQAAAGSPTPTPQAATATPAAGGNAAATPASSTAGATPTPASSSDGTAQKPTNPTSMHVADGSCSVHHIIWTWAGAQNATSYDVVLYNPQTGAVIRDTHTTGTSYALGAGPGATVALKVRSRNSAGTPGTYYTPGDTGRVPPQTTNPTSMTVSTTGHKITWFWTGAKHATAYDFVLYHYDGGTAKTDITGRVAVAHWGSNVTPGVTYDLKVRSVGTCAPSTYYTPARPGKVGA